MKKTNEKENSFILAENAIKGIQEKKGKNIIFIDLSKIGNAVSSYYIVCHADSNRQVNAIADSVKEEVQKHTGEKPFNREGYQNAEWVLLDYVDVVVHVFKKETRDFYNIEDLWADAEIKQVEEDEIKTI